MEDNVSIKKVRVDGLAAPLLLMIGRRGALCCGYVNVDACNKTGDAVAIVCGVNDFDEMLTASVVAVSDAGRELGLSVGQLGREVVERLT